MKQDNEPIYILNTEYYKMIQCMRQTFSRSEYVKKFRASKKSKKRGVKGGVLYDCDLCGKAFKATELEVHHREPVCPIGKHYTQMTPNLIWKRIWSEELDLVCKKCHKHETDEQEIERRK